MTEAINETLTLNGILYDNHDGFPIEMFFIPDNYECQLISGGHYALVKKQQPFTTDLTKLVDEN